MPIFKFGRRPIGSLRDARCTVFLSLALVTSLSNDVAMAASDKRLQYKNLIESLLNRSISMRLFGEFMDIPLDAKTCAPITTVKEAYFVPCKFIDIRIQSFGRQEATFEIRNISSDAATITGNAEFLSTLQADADQLRAGQKDFPLSRSEIARLDVFRHRGFDVGRNSSLWPNGLRYKSIQVQSNKITVER
jgi:hypothetical protein